MHRFQSKTAILRLKFAAFLFCIVWALIPAVGGFLAYSIFRHDLELTVIAMGVGLVTILGAILQCVVAARTRCPLCMTPVLARKGCSKHRNARTFLGSYRLRVALGVLFRDSFLCPYCHEASALEVRSRSVVSGTRHY